MFPGCSSVISKHVAIICLRPSLHLDSTLISMDERVVVASVMDQQHHTVCRVINIYAPADHNVRQDFLCNFLSLPFVNEVDTDPWVLLGDFNMNLHSRAVIQKPAVKPWYEWIMTHFNNCFPQGLPTFTRGDSRTTIDYVFGHHSLAPRLSNATIQFMPCEWTDHSLMAVDILPARQDYGRGTWRFNPTLLHNDSFVALLDETMAQFFISMDHTSTPSPQETWESVKQVIKCTAKRYTQGATQRQKHMLTRLQAERQQLLTDFATSSTPQSRQPSTNQQRLNKIDQAIDTIIQQETQQAMLRSATRWHEKGERSNKYFYNVIKQRQSQQTIQSLKCSQTGTTLHAPKDIISEARQFYQQLYTPDPIHLSDVDRLLSNIPTTAKLSTTDASAMKDKLSRLDLLDIINRTPLGKSPGLDGLPFEVYRHLAPRSTPFCSLLRQVINEAMDGTFPLSWSDTRMVLLYKKGDPELLANWRPLSLINADAKLFTKLIANRVNHVLPNLINPYQTGFMPHRLISDNGWLNQVLMSNARRSSAANQHVAIFLDQEKAYDRVHPEYLRRVLLHFGFPSTLVTSLSKLFFGTRIHVSINGWLGAAFTQGRGLRQGDPLSPLLFNLAFEPMLRSISASTLRGVSFLPVHIARQHKPTPTIVTDLDADITQGGDHVCSSFSASTPVVKLLSYADDLEVFLTKPTEWPILLDLLKQYGRASNAKVNLSKTVMMSLSGKAHSDWIHIAQGYGAEWHDSTSSVAVRYLGYPLYHNQNQLLQYLDEIKQKIIRHATLLKGRNLSVRGASMVANSLLLSRLWHVLRVIPAPATWLKEIKTIIRTFVLSFWPAPAWDTICLPRRYGGLGLIDLEDQAFALHFVYLQRLYFQQRSSDFLSVWVVKYYQLLTGQASLLPLLLFPHRYKSLLRVDSNMYHLCKLLCRLPKLTLAPTWSHRWLLDLPIQEVLIQQDNPQRFPLRYLLSDLVAWDIHRGSLLVHSHRVPQVLLPVLDMIWNPVLQAPHHIPLLEPIGTLQIPRSLLSAPPWQRTTQMATSLLPSLSHWTIQLTSQKTCTIPQLSLTQLRHIWHPCWDQMINRPHPPQYPRPICFHFPPSFWQRFWRIPLPHKAITPWWRLLLDSVSTQSKLHRLLPEKYPSQECLICKAGNEDTYHMFVGCMYKRLFWIDALHLFQLTDLLPNQQSIWHALVTLRSRDNQKLNNSTLCRIGCIIAVIWRYHWHCILEDEFWSTVAIMGMLTSNTLFSSFVPPDNTTLNQ